MFFRPRIFISSVLSIQKIRNKIELLFRNAGAEVLLYERNLTPSVSKETYKHDILDSDFVILILDDKYGTKTDSGISGTHEEYEIIKTTKIPIHVYINKNITDKDQEVFKKEISNDKVSYYLYKNENDLLKRLRETIFQISKEITLNSLDKLQITDSRIKKLGIMKDYESGLILIRDINDILDSIKYFHLGDIDSDIWTVYFEPKIEYYFNYKKWNFIDSKIDELYRKVLLSYNDYAEQSTIIYIYSGQTFKTVLRSNIEIEFHKFKLNNSFDDTQKVQILFNKFYKNIQTLIKTITELKNEVDVNI